MYRLLTFNRLAAEKCKLALYSRKHAVGRNLVGFVGGTQQDVQSAALLQPTRYQGANNIVQRAVYCHLQTTIEKELLSTAIKDNLVVNTTGDCE